MAAKGFLETEIHEMSMYLNAGGIHQLPIGHQKLHYSTSNFNVHTVSVASFPYRTYTRSLGTRLQSVYSRNVQFVQCISGGRIMIIVIA